MPAIDDRCPWCGEDELYQRYHDTVWGVPTSDDRELFEFLILEGAQAGLSWLTILRKRDGYRRVFEDFDVDRLSAWQQDDIAIAMGCSDIVRNRLKIESVVTNARCVADMRSAGINLSGYFWQFVDHQPVQNSWRQMAEVPASTPLSHEISKDMKRRGFRFVGPTIIYAFMQATGMVNDHLLSCPKHAACRALAGDFTVGSST